MSTNGMTSWAVDLADIGAVYPFQGWEFAMFVAGVVFWLGWHVVQLRQEAAEIREDLAADRSGEAQKRAIGRY